MAVPPANQIMRVVGELQIETTGTAGETKGRLVFQDTAKNYFGSFRVFGQYPFARLLLDSAGLSSGVAFRTNTRQGNSGEGGTGEKYSFEVTSSGTNTTYLSIAPPSRNPPYITNRGNPVLEASRSDTSDTTTLYNSLCNFTQSTFKAGEIILNRIGSSFGNGLAYGFYSSTGSTSSTSNLAFIGFQSSPYVSPTQQIQLKGDGTTNIPGRLDVGTVSATTYLNLPPVPSSELLPLTLDKTNNRVGINNTTPTVDLDVNGTTSTSYLTLSSIPSSLKTEVLMYDTNTKAVTYGSVSSIIPDLLPITLDKTNNRVGINQTTPTHDLDVNGTTATRFLLLESIPNIIQPDVLMYDAVSKAVTYSPLSSITPDLTPITLDKVNNRVGINNTSPTQALDVTGAIMTDRLFVKGTLANQGLIFTDTTNNRVGVGTTTPATALDVNGTTTTTNLALTGIASKTKPDILYYDTTTKQVSHGVVPSAPTYGPSFYVRKNNGNTQQINNANLETIIMNSAVWNIDSCYDMTTNRFTPNVPGYYHLIGHVQMTYGMAGSYGVLIGIRQNGSSVDQLVLYETPTRYSTLTPIFEISCIFKFNGTTDYAEFQAATYPGYVYGEEKRTNFMGCFLRPL